MGKHSEIQKGRVPQAGVSGGSSLQFFQQPDSSCSCQAFPWIAQVRFSAEKHLGPELPFSSQECAAVKGRPSFLLHNVAPEVGICTQAVEAVLGFWDHILGSHFGITFGLRLHRMRGMGRWGVQAPSCLWEKNKPAKPIWCLNSEVKTT